jgi:hypothetical protein
VYIHTDRERDGRRRRLFLPAVRLTCKCKYETSKMLHFERGFVWCSRMDISESRSEIPGKFLNVVLEKDGEGKLDRSCWK